MSAFGDDDGELPDDAPSRKRSERPELDAETLRRSGGQTRKVRRGHNLNTLNREPRAYGLLTRMEGPPEAQRRGVWWLRFECLDADWFDQVVDQVMVQQNLRQHLDHFLGGQTFGGAWALAANNPAARHEHALVYGWYIDRYADEDPPRFRGILEGTIDANVRHMQQPELDVWFELRVIDRANAPDAHGIFTLIDRNGVNTEIAVAVDVGLMRRVLEPRQSHLQALHHPNFEPAPPPPPLFQQGPPPWVPAGPVPLADDDLDGLQDDLRIMLDEVKAASSRFVAGIGAALTRVEAQAAAIRAACEDLLRPLVEPAIAPGWGLALAGAGAPWSGLHAYIGDPNPNPMDPGAPPPHQPFVGVVNIGQGNLNMIVGADWRIQAYYDYGFTTDHADGPAAVAATCFCGQPTMVLSHWDLDHYKSALDPAVSGVLTLQWIVPEQQTGPQGNGLMSRIKKAGGQVCVWRSQGGAASHMRFPWGFLSRCTGGGTNGSGIAAMVCLRDTPGAAAAPAGVPIAAGVNASPAGAEVARARLAVAQVAGAVAAAGLGGVANLPALASPIAAALAASNYGATATAAECADVAVQAANAALGAGGAPAPVGAAIGALPLAGLTPPRLASARGASVQAALAVVAAPANDGARCQAAAATFTATPGALHADVRAVFDPLVAAAQRAHPAAPILYTGDAPFDAGERYALLNGDANFEYVPPMMANPPPAVVALTAMHHGSMLEDGELLHTARIPWAPGSAAAAAAHAAAAAAGNVVDQANAAAGGAVQLATARAAAAAAAAVHAVAPGAAAFLIDPATTAKLVAAAAAAVIAAHRYADACCAGKAATLCATFDTTLAPVGRVVAVTNGCLGVARGGGPPAAVNAALADRVRASGIFHATRDTGDVVAAIGVAPAAVAIGGPATGAAATAAGTGNTLVAQPLTYLPLLSALAQQAVVGWLAAAGVAAAGADAAAAGAVGVAAVNVTAATGAAAFAGDASTIPLAARLAARFAAEGVAADAALLDYETVAAGLRAVTSGTAGNATAVQALAAAGQIAYSYGVTGAGAYRYKAATLGNTGHAHPAAVREYIGRGWARRFNTSPNAHLGAQADGSPRGHLALCWNATADQAPAMGHYTGTPNAQINYVCPDCALALAFNF